jgi:hypothetical protein
LDLIHQLPVQRSVLSSILLNDFPHIWILLQQLIHVVLGQCIEQALSDSHGFPLPGLIEDDFIVAKVLSVLD